MAFVLKDPSASFWKTVTVDVATETDGWQKAKIPFQFRRVGRDELDAAFQRDDSSKMTTRQQVDRLMPFLTGWDVVDDRNNPVDLTAEGLMSLADKLGGLCREVEVELTKAIYGIKEKN